MALRPPRALRGWWRYSRLVGWRLAVLAVAAGSSVTLAAGVAGHPGQEWTTLAVTIAVRLGGSLATGAVRAERARRYGCW
jgi:hypothetical protein